ncbi:hypothetical protein LPB41_07210 [Thalassospira sp. MA62]|nr:hypothetical protein [Thalassospira sp. MA62]
MATYEEITNRYISSTEIEAGVRKGQQLRAEFVGAFFRNLFKGAKSSDANHPAGTVGGAA